MWKRSFDVVSALSGLVFLSPVFFLIAVVIVLTYHFPIFFLQKRVGRGGEEFTLYKFRTMNVHEGAEGGSFDAGSMARITEVGRVLRRTKLDELPQLWNVLRGDMSLVGPRPEVRKWVDAYPKRWAIVLAVRPGITDPASIEFRNEEELLATQRNPESYYREIILQRKLDLYEQYVKNCTFLGDLGILWKTFVALFR
jgi:lipopolysaccharide/colanic/teichoic acid biosynthesis glycosyltransferase